MEHAVSEPSARHFLLGSTRRIYGPHSLLTCQCWSIQIAALVQHRDRHKSFSRKCTVDLRGDSNHRSNWQFALYSKCRIKESTMWNPHSPEGKHLFPEIRQALYGTLFDNASVLYFCELLSSIGSKSALSIISDRKLDVNQTDNYWVLSLRLILRNALVEGFY